MIDYFFLVFYFLVERFVIFLGVAIKISCPSFRALRLNVLLLLSFLASASSFVFFCLKYPSLLVYTLFPFPHFTHSPINLVRFFDVSIHSPFWVPVYFRHFTQ